MSGTYEKQIAMHMEYSMYLQEQLYITREAIRRLNEEKEKKEAGQKAIDSLVARANSGDKTAQSCALLLGLRDPYEHLGMKRSKPGS